MMPIFVPLSEIVRRSNRCCSSVVEHFLGKEEVTSSSLVNSSKNQEVAIDATSFFVPFQEQKRGKKGLPRANVVPIVVP